MKNKYRLLLLVAMIGVSLAIVTAALAGADLSRQGVQLGESPLSKISWRENRLTKSQLLRACRLRFLQGIPMDDCRTRPTQTLIRCACPAG